MKKTNRRKGFTIVELVIVIAVIAILAAVLIPTYNNVVESAKSTAALEEAKNTLTSYNAYMLTQTEGTGLSEGAVFYNPNYGYYYTYVASSIKAVTDKESVDALNSWTAGRNDIGETALPEMLEANDISTLPTVTIDGVVYACDTLGVSKVGDDYYAFAFRNGLEVKFSDGSSQCEIYAGRVVAKYVALTGEWDTATLPDAVKVTYSGSNYTSSSQSDAALVTGGYSCTLTAATGYTITGAVATIGGEAVTTQSFESGVLTITGGSSNITGDIVITVTAVAG